GRLASYKARRHIGGIVKKADPRLSVRGLGSTGLTKGVFRERIDKDSLLVMQYFQALKRELPTRSMAAVVSFKRAAKIQLCRMHWRCRSAGRLTVVPARSFEYKRGEIGRAHV